MTTILWALVGGTLLGVLGKLVAPGDRDDVPLWLLILCGIGGVLLGNLLYTRLFEPDTLGVDWWRHAWQVVVAAVLVAVAAVVTGERARRRT